MWALSISMALLAIGCQSATTTPVSPPLVGTSWIAEDIDGGGALERPQSTVTFESAERAVGSTGCNRYFAALDMSAERVRFRGAGSTRMACASAVMEQERRFLAALEAVRTYRLAGDTLWLFDESGQARLRLTG